MEQTVRLQDDLYASLIVQQLAAQFSWVVIIFVQFFY